MDGTQEPIARAHGWDSRAQWKINKTIITIILPSDNNVRKNVYILSQR
jgi:hypothetical protein